MTALSTRQFAFVGSLLLAMLSGSAPVVDAHGGDQNLVHSCVNISSGTIKIVAPNQSCGQNEIPLDWSVASSANSCKGNDDNDIMVKVGSVCVDKYEASVWSSPTGGTQYGTTSDDYPCGDNGNDCTGTTAIYGRSVAGATPSAFVTWFQAQQACANAGKRLLTNAEWQMAAAGTPDPGTDNGITDCHVSGVPTSAVVDAGSRSSCVSNWGAFDMVGNLTEWVADWVAQGTGCSQSWGDFSDDFQCFSGQGGTDQPGALVRGDQFHADTDAGVFSVGNFQPWVSGHEIGFRCGR